ncbi:MAG: DUF2235 domain-containing protein [Verrucomicrobiaceae bacterium]
MKTPTFTIIGIVLALLSSCGYRIQYAPNPDTPRRLAPGEDGVPKKIQVFFDGTANDWEARTNVRRRFELMASAEDPQFPCLYIEGVGVGNLSGKVLGLGMKQRVLQAYTFLARHWSKDRNDSIQIYGFSRGAFQARMLAGLMAHCGLPDAVNTPKSEKDLHKLATSVWDYCVDQLKDPEEPADGSRIPLSKWLERLAENQRKVRELPNHQGWTFNTPSIDFLGIWDTVPGLPFTTLKAEGEVMAGKKQRYKVRPYPNIKVVAHALSLDEKRSRFAPLLVGAPIDPHNKVHEVWFPGAHSDVGGGYADSNDMAGITMVWMQDVMILENVTKRKHTFYSDAHGLLHHPEAALVNRITGHELSRRIPKDSYIHFSAFKRANQELHPEENSPYGSAYQPTLVVEQPCKSDHLAQPPLILKVSGAIYTERTAADELKKVGLKLYGQNVDTDNSTKGLPLSISQMAVIVKTVSQPSVKPESKPKQ